MKRFLMSLIALTCCGLGCTPERTDVFIQSVVIPKADPVLHTCKFESSDPTRAKVNGVINVGAQKDLNGGLLSAYYGFQVENTVITPPSQTPPGSAGNTANRDDAIFKGLDIVATEDSTNQVLVTETIPASGYANHAGGIGVAVGDIIGKKLQDALLARSTNFGMHLGVKVKGSFVAGSDFETGEYSFPMQVIYGGGVIAPTDGGPTIIPLGATNCE